MASHTFKAPLLPSALPETSRPQPQLEQFVSVFDFDSDSEEEDERRSFARRIKRGLHKKSASEKRYTAERKVGAARHTVSGGEASEKHARERARQNSRLSRGRGGSLGRIFGLMR
ncbi:hypothetical protein ONZ43_g5755 [Nemania bipapillata]|uniref:Uncharacterized protein n=1 Tax=Nemania bipapillata TaxID=110536 RepID=A0ACC2I6U8_9PEZI|nr:hypothetical protein ONZ43_g5755 [Nemania bipapillata]